MLAVDFPECLLAHFEKCSGYTSASGEAPSSALSTTNNVRVWQGVPPIFHLHLSLYSLLLYSSRLVVRLGQHTMNKDRDAERADTAAATHAAAEILPGQHVTLITPPIRLHRQPLVPG
jgi:hypothetical protein